MNYVVDAWLERRTPRLRVLEAVTGSVVAQIEGPGVRAALDRYDVLPRDLLQRNSHAHTRMAAGLVSEIRDRRRWPGEDGHTAALKPELDF